jgi:hypothetical protein
VGGRGLKEFAEARAGVGESPGRQLNPELVQGSDEGIALSRREHLQPSVYMIRAAHRLGQWRGSSAAAFRIAKQTRQPKTLQEPARGMP